MESFWKQCGKVWDKGDWQYVVAVWLTAPDIKNITVLFRNNSGPHELTEDWLMWAIGRERKALWLVGIWTGEYVFLRRSMEDNRLVHLPSSVELEVDRSYVSYVGQPHISSRCGSEEHFLGCSGVQSSDVGNMAIGWLCAPERTNAHDGVGGRGWREAQSRRVYLGSPSKVGP